MLLYHLILVSRCRQLSPCGLVRESDCRGTPRFNPASLAIRSVQRPPRWAEVSRRCIIKDNITFYEYSRRVAMNTLSIFQL
jgi:hypothetical protein